MTRIRPGDKVRPKKSTSVLDAGRTYIVWAVAPPGVVDAYTGRPTTEETCVLDPAWDQSYPYFWDVSRFVRVESV